MEKLKLGRFSKTSTKENVKHLTTAERLRLAFEDLGPAFVKLGQLLSSRPDLVPPEFVEEFKKLQDNVGAIPFSKIEEVFNSEYKRPWQDIFDYVDEQPLAAASIAQVHRATLKSGEKVVIKIQRPGILPVIEEDLSILYNVASLLETYVPEMRVYNPIGIVDEFFRTLELETNFIIEANNILRFRKNFLDDEVIVIPKVYLNYCTAKVLVLEEMTGKRLSEANALKEVGIDPSHVVQEGLRAFFNMVFRDGFFHGDLHAGNIFVLPNQKIGVVDFGVVGRLSIKARESITVMLLALSNEDYEQLAYEFVDISPFNEEVQVDHFAYDLRGLIAPYFGLSFKNINIGKLLLDATTIASKHGIKLPNELLLFFKAVLTIEGMGRSIINDFDLLKYTEQFASEIIRHRYDPSKLSRNLSVMARDAIDVVGSLPRHLKHILRRVNSPGYATKFHLENLEDLRKTIEISSNLIFLGLVIGSLILASAISLHATEVRSIFDLSFATILFVITAIGFGLVAFYNYIRKR